jgi:uncharacterized Ntn-hydrolase superfamily protein
LTYSILARDPETGAFGMAVQSHFFGVGRLVGWLEPGLGGVATQAFVNVGLGPKGLELLRSGSDAQTTLDALVAGDEMPEFRQVAVVDATGRVAVFTGDRCVPATGSRTGEQVVAQGNMLVSDTVYESMIDAYEQSTAPFPERLVAALRAAEDHGGDARGSQSAAVKVVAGEPSDAPWEQTLVDLRVDDHTDPVGEITRLLALHRAYEDLGAAMFTPGLVIGDIAEVSEADLDGALTALEEARISLGDILEAGFWKAVVLARSGRAEAAEALFEEVFAAGPHFRAYRSSVEQAGFLGAVPAAAE